MAYSMITVFGMNDKVGNVSFYGLSQDQFNKPFSDDTATLIDEEVRKLIDKQYVAAQELLKDKRKELDIIAQQLLEKEVLHKSDIVRLIGARPYTEDSIFTPQNSMNQNSNGKFNELFEEDEIKEA
jgi:cell division protease FtsH